MQICVVGVNYKTTPGIIRGKLAIGTGQLHDALQALHEYVPQGIILCTCNRTEIYSVAQGELDESASVAFLKVRANLSQADLMQYIYIYHGEAAVSHLFRVASGLDSMIIGEYEILGQVRRALEEAEKACMVDLPLRNLFNAAIRTGRHIRAHTDISKNALSVSSVAVDLASRAVGDISKSRVVIIGAGEAGRLAAEASRDRGASQIVVVNRSPEKGRALAAELQGTWSPMEQLGQELANCDVVISCSGAPHTVLKYDLVAEVMNARPEHPLVIIDIAVPPDVEYQVRQLKNIVLYDIDELTGISDSNRRQRESEILDASEILDQEVQKFMSGWQELEVKPLITALVRKSEEIRQANLGKTLKKLPNLTDEERTHLDAMTRAIVKKILHEPIQSLKDNHKEEGHLEIIKELFNLDE